MREQTPFQKKKRKNIQTGSKYELSESSTPGCKVIRDLTGKDEKADENKIVGYLWYPTSKRGKWASER